MSKELTAMQEHISDMEEIIFVVKGLQLGHVVSSIESAIDNAKYYLPKERKQIEYAFNSGYEKGESDGVSGVNTTT